jgi:hypothetical protein
MESENTTEAQVETTQSEAPQEEQSIETQTTEDSIAEEKLFANKYKSIEELEKGYENLNSLYNKRYKGFVGSPEDGKYEFVPSEGINDEIAQAILDTPMAKRLQEKGVERGMSNEMFNDLINDYIVTQQEHIEAQRTIEYDKLGENADKRLQLIDEKLGTLLEPHLKKALSDSLTTAEAVQAIEYMLESKTQNTVNPEGTQVKNGLSEEEWQKMYLAVDEYGNRKMNDPSYRKKVEKLYEQVSR